MPGGLINSAILLVEFEKLTPQIRNLLAENCRRSDGPVVKIEF